MAHLIRRHSMERLELYDLDKLTTIRSIDYQLPPPLPPPRIPHLHHHRRPSMNPTLERYQFLCNTTRSKTDPIYAATPMFMTIPQSSKEKPHRQLLGSYIRLENVTPLSQPIPNSPEPKKVETVKNTEKHKEEKEKEEEEDEDDNDIDDEKEENNDQSSGSSSSSSSSDDEQEKDDDKDILNDDDDKKGIVEQIFNRDKKE